jgi:hypothetical protein
MRYLVGFVMLSLVASPLNAAAQSSDETSPHAAAPFSLEYDPALQPYEEARDRVLQSRNGIIGSSVVMALGAALVGGGAALQRNEVKQEGSLDTGVVVVSIGAVTTTAGIVGMIVSGVRLSKRKRELREAHAVPLKPPSDPALRLHLDSAGLEMAPTPPLTAEDLVRSDLQWLSQSEARGDPGPGALNPSPSEGSWLTLHELDFDQDRLDGFYVEGAVKEHALEGLVGGGVASSANYESESDSLSNIDLGPGPGLILAGTIIALPGLIGMAVSGGKLAKRKRELRDLRTRTSQLARTQS